MLPNPKPGNKQQKSNSITYSLELIPVSLLCGVSIYCSRWLTKRLDPNRLQEEEPVFRVRTNCSLTFTAVKLCCPEPAGWFWSLTPSEGVSGDRRSLLDLQREKKKPFHLVFLRSQSLASLLLHPLSCLYTILKPSQLNPNTVSFFDGYQSGSLLNYTTKTDGTLLLLSGTSFQLLLSISDSNALIFLPQM